MSDCCSSSENKVSHPKKLSCPKSTQLCTEVLAKTITHHLKESWKWKDKGIRYFFCEDPKCDVVYFGEDNSIITKSQLRTLVGVKEASNATPACYCFGISKADAINDPSIREYVLYQTKHAQCSCDVSNPSGRCCLKDFPRSGKPPQT